MAFVVSALMLPAVLGCFAAGTVNAQSMRCCAAEVNCPQHQKTCLSTTVPVDNFQPIPPARISLAAPSLAANTYPQVEELTAAFFGSSRAGDAPEYSPPELYALHSALLI